MLNSILKQTISNYKSMITNVTYATANTTTNTVVNPIKKLFLFFRVSAHTYLRATRRFPRNLPRVKVVSSLHNQGNKISNEILSFFLVITPRMEVIHCCAHRQFTLRTWLCLFAPSLIQRLVYGVTKLLCLMTNSKIHAFLFNN
jgi:hypothetical protein